MEPMRLTHIGGPTLLMELTKHFAESRREIARAFEAAGLSDRLNWADAAEGE